MDFACSNCSAPVKLTERTAVLIKCGYCNTQYIRKNEGFDQFGESAILPPDISPLQVGTYGNFQGNSFRITGRSKIKWENGYWNEWQLSLDSSDVIWLAEAQGLWAISQLICEFNKSSNDPQELRYLQAFNNRSNLEIQGSMFVPSDYKKAFYHSFEGELCFIPSFGEQINYLDFLNRDAQFASIENNAQHFRIFMGRYADFSEFNFSNLRELPGWKFNKLVPEL